MDGRNAFSLYIYCTTDNVNRSNVKTSPNYHENSSTVCKNFTSCSINHCKLGA